MKNILSKFILILLCLITITGCNLEKERVEAIEQNTIEFPLELLSSKNDPAYSSENLYLNPKSVNIRGSKVYIGLNQKVFAIDTSNKSIPKREILIENKDYKLITFNTPGFVSGDSKGYVYLENIKLEEDTATIDSKKESVQKKTEHRILKFDYEGNFLFFIGPYGKNATTNFSSDEDIIEMSVDINDNLSIIVRKLDEDVLKSTAKFTRKNIDIFTYKFIKIDTNGRVIYTINLSNIKPINRSTDNYIRVIENIKLNPNGNKLFISTKDYFKKELSKEDFSIEIKNSQIFIYDLDTNTLMEKTIKLDDECFYLLGISNDDKIFVCKPSDTYETRFLVINLKGNIEENKKIVILNVRQHRYDFFLDPEGYISAIFKEKDKIRIIQYR
jgi:hypothetical protein